MKISIITCKDCKHYNAETKGCKRNPSVEGWKEEDFCSYGKGFTKMTQKISRFEFQTGLRVIPKSHLVMPTPSCCGSCPLILDMYDDQFENWENVCAYTKHKIEDTEIILSTCPLESLL